jgi:hypothetical protein
MNTIVRVRKEVRDWKKKVAKFWKTIGERKFRDARRHCYLDDCLRFMKFSARDDKLWSQLSLPGASLLYLEAQSLP